MTLLLGAVLSDRVVLASGSLTLSSGLRTGMGPKIERVGDWLIAHAGDTADWYAWRAGLDLTLLDDSEYHADRMLWLKGLNDKQKSCGVEDGVSLHLLLARGRELYGCNHKGGFWPSTGFEAQGGSWPLATYLWQRKVPLLLDAALVQAEFAAIIEEVSTIDTTVLGPAWFGDTKDLLVWK